MTPLQTAAARRAAAAGTRRTATAARPAPGRRATTTKPRVYRRVSGPVQKPVRNNVAVPAARPGMRPLPVLGTIGSHALKAGKTVHNSSLLDRLLRGRGWIALLGVLLIGLVALNVGLLKLNAQAGRNAEQARTLRIKNANLNAVVTKLSSAERIERAAARQGLVKAPAGSIHYIKPKPASDGPTAAKRLAEGGFATGTTAAGDTTAAVDPTTTDTQTTDPGAASDTVVTDPATDPTAQTDPSTGGVPDATGVPTG